MNNINTVPRLSVIMPVYNDALFLRDAIDSILHQTYRDFEFIIINDGSTDNSSDILESYADERIFIINNSTNLGLSIAPNIGYHRARGEYIARMDADDISVPDRFEKQVGFLDQHPHIGLVAAFIQYIDEDNQVLRKREYPTGSAELRHAFLEQSINNVCHPTIMFRKEKAEEIGFYREELPSAEDFDFLLRFVENFDIATIPEVLHLYRIKSYGISTEKREQQMRCFDLVYQLSLERRKYGFDTLQKGSKAEKEKLLKDIYTISRLANRKATASRLYRRSSRILYHGGGRQKARKWIRRSLVTYPFASINAWKVATVCYFGPKVVDRLRKIKDVFVGMVRQDLSIFSRNGRRHEKQ